MPKPHPRLLAGLVALPAAALLVAGCAGVRFAVLGDAPYCLDAAGGPVVCTPADVDHRRVAGMLAAIDRERLPFVVHVGDVFAPAAGDCAERAFTVAAGLLHAGRTPLVTLPGDNETTNCPDPREALLRFRRHFTSVEAGPPGTRRDPARPEDVLWVHRGVVFAGITTPDPPFPDGEAASLGFLRRAFDLARRRRAPLVLFTHAQPSPASYALLDAALVAGARELGRPVLLVHGNTHVFEVEPGYRDVASLTRHQVAGYPEVAWSLVTFSRRSGTFAVRRTPAPDPHRPPDDPGDPR